MSLEELYQEFIKELSHQGAGWDKIIKFLYFMPKVPAKHGVMLLSCLYVCNLLQKSYGPYHVIYEKFNKLINSMLEELDKSIESSTN